MALWLIVLLLALFSDLSPETLWILFIALTYIGVCADDVARHAARG